MHGAFTLDTLFHILGQGRIGRILVSEIGIAPAIRRNFERMQHGGARWNVDIRHIAVPDGFTRP